jgi:tRNA 2-selenouridine synthase
MLIEYRETGDDVLFVDLRTPLEYAEGSIGKAVNIPIFSNEERVEIGTTYKQVSVEKAKMMAIEAVSKKLPEIYGQITELVNTGRKLVLFCARGGMRSQTFGSLLRAMGYDIRVLSGGYKGYRNAVLELIEEKNRELNYVVIHGNTGTGKTKILVELRSLGAQVFDIEGLARHRGSLLGKVGIKEEITQKQFEHELYETIKDFDGRPVYVEAESKRLGMIVVPGSIIDRMAASPYHVNISLDIEKRIDNVLEEYEVNDDTIDEIMRAISKLKKFVGAERAEWMEDMIRTGELREFSRFLMEGHYDPKYEHKKYEFILDLDNSDPASTAASLEEFFSKGMM